MKARAAPMFSPRNVCHDLSRCRRNVGVAQPQEPLSLIPLKDCKLEALHKSLERMSRSLPVIKKKILDACVTCVMADKRVTTPEAELLRAVADALDCPMPPIMATGTGEMVDG